MFGKSFYRDTSLYKVRKLIMIKTGHTIETIQQIINFL